MQNSHSIALKTIRLKSALSFKKNAIRHNRQALHSFILGICNISSMNLKDMVIALKEKVSTSCHFNDHQSCNTLICHLQEDFRLFLNDFQTWLGLLLPTWNLTWSFLNRLEIWPGLAPTDLKTALLSTDTKYTHTHTHSLQTCLLTALSKMNKITILTSQWPTKPMRTTAKNE